MNRNIDYIIDEDSAGLRVEQFLRRKRYSGQNLSEIKRMPKSIWWQDQTILLETSEKVWKMLQKRIGNVELKMCPLSSMRKTVMRY